MTSSVNSSGLAASGGTLPSDRVSASSGRHHRPLSGGGTVKSEGFAEPSSEHEQDDHSQMSAGDLEANGDDGHNALINQTLNSDGTPKRPMNAFMIFARKRRPEVSAANQMMRTGEISKILSREWTSMPMSEKQFYLDQAKRLKDKFNMKYPDYVYRRRPNNSRRRRRTDGSIAGRGATFDNSMNSSSIAGTGEQHDLDHDHERDDGSGSTEFEGDSPVDMHMSGMAAPPLGYSDSAIVIHPPHPSLSLTGLGSTGSTGSAPHLGLAPVHMYARSSFPPSASGSTSASEHTSGLSPLSPMSPYETSPASASHSHTHFSPYASTGTFNSGYSHGYGSAGDDFGSATAYHGHSNAPAPTSRMPHLDWPPPGPASAPVQSAHSPIVEAAHSPIVEAAHQQPHSAYDSPAPGFWGGGRYDVLGRNGNAGGGSNWVLPSLPSLSQGQRARALTAGSILPPPAGNLSLGLGTDVSATAVAAAAPLHHRERAWSNTPSNASGSSGSTTSPATGMGTGPGLAFPTLTEAYRPGQQSSPVGGGGSALRSASTSPTVGLSHGDLYDQSQSGYPISPISPQQATAGSTNASYFSSTGASAGAGSAANSNGGGSAHLFPPLQQTQGQGQQRGPPSLLHPISTFTGPGGGGVHNGSPRGISTLSAVSPHPHSSGGSGYWAGERSSDGR